MNVFVLETAMYKDVENSIILLGPSYNAGKQRLLKTKYGANQKGVVFSIFVVIISMVMPIQSLLPIEFWSCYFKQK